MEPQTQEQQGPEAQIKIRPITVKLRSKTSNRSIPNEESPVAAERIGLRIQNFTAID